MSNMKRLLENIQELYYNETKDAFVIAKMLNVPESLVIDAIEFELKQNQTNERKWWH